MPHPLSLDDVRRLRMRSQRLVGDRPHAVSEVVAAMGAVQAQSTPAARLAIRPRSTGANMESVRHATNVDRSVVRTWAMRGTLHMIAAADVRWVLELLRPRASAGRRRRLELGLDDELCQRALRLLERLLAGRSLTRAEIGAALSRHGVQVDRTGQAMAHLLAYAARQAVICRGPDRADEPTYVLLAEWVPEPATLRGDAALAELARRYVGAFGPASAADLAHWAGITLTRARQAVDLVRTELREVEVAGEPAWLRTDCCVEPVPGDAPSVRLLPHFDNYLLGYRDRDVALDPSFAARIHAGGGMIHPAVVADGKVVARWRVDRSGSGDHVTVAVEPFRPVDHVVASGLAAEVADIGRFLGVEATLVTAPVHSAEAPGR